MSVEPETGYEERTKRDRLAEYRADCDDFGRLLYLVFEEIRIQGEARENTSPEVGHLMPDS
jgi:hypothetical protein